MTHRRAFLKQLATLAAAPTLARIDREFARDSHDLASAATWAAALRER